MKFEILNHESMYSGRAFNVDRVEARLPDGQVRHYDLVQHRGAVTLVPVDVQGRVWFVRQYRIGADAELLELPAGVMESGEDPALSAAREIREEIGMAARSLEKIGEFFMAPGYSSEFMFVYLATDLYAAPLPADADEFLQTEAIPLVEALQMARDGRIRDGKTLAALLLAQEALQKLK